MTDTSHREQLPPPVMVGIDTDWPDGEPQAPVDLVDSPDDELDGSYGALQFLDDDDEDDEHEDDEHDDDDQELVDEGPDANDLLLEEAARAAAEREDSPTTYAKFKQVIRDMNLGEKSAKVRDFLSYLRQTQLTKEHRRRNYVAIGLFAVALLVALRQDFAPSPAIILNNPGQPAVESQSAPLATQVVNGVTVYSNESGFPIQQAPEVAGQRPPYHVVQQFDTMSSIARLYGLNLAELVAANPQVADPNKIWGGDVLILPPGPIVPEAAPTVTAPVPTGEAVAPVVQNVAPEAVVDGSQIQHFPIPSYGTRENTGIIQLLGTVLPDGRYVTAEGDSFGAISRKFNVSLNDLYLWNGNGPLYMGDVLNVTNPHHP